MNGKWRNHICGCGSNKKFKRCCMDVKTGRLIVCLEMKEEEDEAPV